MSLEWMAWTAPTAIFVGTLFLMLALLTAMSVRHRSVARKGFLPIETELGDRIYIGLLTAGLGMVAWLAITSWPLTPASALGAIWLAIVLRWG